MREIVVALAAAMAVSVPPAQRDPAQARATITRLLRGERVSEEEMANLERVVVMLQGGGAQGVRLGRGVEEGGPARGDIHIVHIEAGRESAAERELLKMQREILMNQRELFKTTGGVAREQERLGARSGRVESGVRDMTGEMKASSAEMQKVRGEAAGTDAKVTEVARTTTDMAAAIQKLSKNVEEIEDAIKDVDLTIQKTYDAMK